MAILLKPYRAIYVDVPKVGCTTLKTALAPSLGIDLRGRSCHSVRYPQPVSTPIVADLLYWRYFKFGFVRNPWDRIVSCYKDKIQDTSTGEDTLFTIKPGVANCLARFEEFCADMSFDAFVDGVASIPDSRADEHFKSQHCFFLRENGGWPADFVGRLERFNDDWEVVRERLCLPADRLTPLKATPSTSYRDFYSPQARQRIHERYRADIETFGYSF